MSSIEQVEVLSKVARCPECGHAACLMRKQGPRFRITCLSCGFHTDWGTKLDAIIDWYNSVLEKRSVDFGKK